MLKDLDASIHDALSRVDDPELHVDLVTAGMVKNVSVDGDTASVLIELTTPACPLKEQIDREVRGALDQVAGLASYDLTFTARVRAADAGGGRAPLPGISNIVAVASGKGGVGKSTAAVNLALALAGTGASVGLLDADIHGPSVPKMVGLPTRQPEAKGGRMQPFTVETAGLPVKIMSMAFFLEDDQPVVWRGPMLHKALQQFLQDVDWGELDYLLIDMPPGTGDVQLSLSQTVPLTGAVIVTTPQDVALLDVRKAVSMVAKVEVPLLGVLENMASFECPDCKSKHAIFGEGGGESLARELGVAFLGSIPLDSIIRVGGDEGRAAVLREDPGPAGRALIEAAHRVAGQVSIRRGGAGFTRELPVIS